LTACSSRTGHPPAEGRSAAVAEGDAMPIDATGDPITAAAPAAREAGRNAHEELLRASRPFAE